MKDDPNFGVCKLIALLVLFFMTVFSAACCFGSATVSAWDGCFWYGIGTIVFGCGLRILVFKWFDIEG